jgi:NAD+ synthase
MKTDFSPEKTLDELLAWMQEMMISTGGNKAVIGISGGKDSSVTAALSCRAFGQENVYGVLLPDSHQADIAYAYEICEFLGIHHTEIDISYITSSIYRQLHSSAFFKEFPISAQTQINLPARVRMTVLYAISQSIEGSRVLNTGNLSEDWIGYATLYGDTAGAFAPLGMLISEEVIAIGRELGIPEKFLIKPPADGLTNKTDEEVFGYSYKTLNDYIRLGIAPEAPIKSLIDQSHLKSRFKFQPIPMFNPGLPIKAPQVGDVYPSGGQRK